MSKLKNNKKGILLPPVVGYSFKVLFNLINSNKIQLRYFPKLLVITLFNFVNFPFRCYERKFINPKFLNNPIEKDPIFILGHWRSGTTHLHNLLCQDAQMAYVTTYQSVYPDTLFNKLGRVIFLGFSNLLIPGNRKGDNVALGLKLPQEEEFALGDKIPISFYYFWLFPKNIIKYYNSFIRFKNIDFIQLEKWKLYYKLLIKKAIKNTKRDRFLSKNPPNTGRIKIILKMFPNAKFIHIYRNPIDVFLSTQNFYKKMLPHLKLQNITQEEIDRDIIKIYKNIMNDYFDQKDLIPFGNLVEISFEELEKNPNDILKSIYNSLNIEGYVKAAPHFEEYITSLKSYKKNKHTISRKQLDILNKEWGFTMEKWNYNIPTNIKVENENSNE